jgi:BirA family biotin operon repressor/biotin-[acetyl-CoA-carboxylase] ligase
MTRIIGRRVLDYDRVTSTNDLARLRAEEGEPEGLVITTEEQSAGRGRLGRGWIVPPHSSIQLSVLLRPPLAPIEAQSITQMAALGVAATLRELVEMVGSSPLPTVTLKWPNDVLLNGKKCAGILVETGVEDDRLAFAILGVGINVNYTMSDYPDLAPFATTLADELGHAVDRDTLEDALMTKLDACYARLRESRDGRWSIFQEWRGRLSTLGHAVRVAMPKGIEVGIAEDVDTDGALLLRREGDLIRVYSADVTVLKEANERRPE